MLSLSKIFDTVITKGNGMMAQHQRLLNVYVKYSEIFNYLDLCKSLVDT